MNSTERGVCGGGAKNKGGGGREGIPTYRNVCIPVRVPARAYTTLSQPGSPTLRTVAPPPDKAQSSCFSQSSKSFVGGERELQEEREGGRGRGRAPGRGKHEQPEELWEWRFQGSISSTRTEKRMGVESSRSVTRVTRGRRFLVDPVRPHLNWGPEVATSSGLAWYSMA